MANLGSLAAAREAQVINWVYENRRNDSFTADTVFFSIFEGRPMNDRMIKQVGECYRVACRDLCRKQVFKQGGDPKLETYALNEDDETMEIINEARNTVQENEM